MAFDLNSIVPEGYECVGVRQPEKGDFYLLTWCSEPLEWLSTAPSSSKSIILRKKWTPQPGELIAVRQYDGYFVYKAFKEFDAGGMPRCYADAVKKKWDNWYQYRQLTDEELATLFPRRD